MGSQGGGGNVSNANAGVPASSRKVVQILKEIVNCPDLEIYTMLVECDMDPEKTISCLLSQDTFREVKSKRDKKKETKDPADSWTHNISNLRARSSGNDGYNTNRGSGNIFNSNETGSTSNVNKSENKTHNYWAGSSSTPGVLGCQPPLNSDPKNAEVRKTIPMGSSEALTSSLLLTPASQSTWVNAKPGQRTMADIVKMGRPRHEKNVVMPPPSKTQENGSKAALKDDEWPSLKKQDVSYPLSSLLKPSADSKTSVDQFSEPQHLGETRLVDEVRETKINPIVSPPDSDQVAPALVSNRNLRDKDYSRDFLLYENKKNKVEGYALEENGGEDVSTYVATGFHQLTTENEENHETLGKEDKPLVAIHNHIQVHTSLMFDSFGLGLGSGKVRSGLNDNLEETKGTEDNSSFRHPKTDFSGKKEEKIRNATTDEQISYQIYSTARNYHASLDSETEAAQGQPPPQEDQEYKFSSPADYRFENSQHLNPPSETNPQMQNLDNFPNVMQQGYTSSLPNNFLPSCIQDVRESGRHYSLFPAEYNNAIPSSFSCPAISMSETQRAACISPQNAMLGAAQQATTLAEYLALNSYPHHPGIPLEYYADLIRYLSMSHSYIPYMPSAFQQASPADNYQSMLPQYKILATPSPIPLPFAYEFGGGASTSNNYPLNPTSPRLSYKDVLTSQSKESNHLASSLQQQNENLAAWHQGQQPNSHVIPRSGYDSLPGHQNDQQPPGFRQVQLQQQQQPSQQQQQHFGGDGYVSPFHSQAPMSLEHLHHQQQQNARDASKQIQQQLWPNNY